MAELHRGGGQACGGRVTQVLAQRAGRAISLRPERLVSTMPLGSLVRALVPSAPPHVLQAAQSLRHRDFLIVTLVVRAKEIFPDNWLYIHDPQFRVGRVQNFRNWSVEMVADPELTTLGMEYFCSRGDELWELKDDALIRLATREMVSLGFAPETQVEGGFVIRQPNAYPVYDDDYAGHVSVVRDYLAGFENLATVGRSGMHRYNNQDHSMISAMSAVHQLLGKGAACPWTVNTEKSGHEERAQEPCVRER
ncbi:hypothetical protein [Verrucomicrobium spinosum]|uniref:hypothetical protein n=1 Tax=Verrucomicrobium spinosum TaxID=2736 RepID=UPI000B0264D8|nr:hypothetical protein [Verrucomicrobium spinosum]